MNSYLQICRGKLVKDPNQWVVGFYCFELPNRHYIITSLDSDFIHKERIIPATLCVCSGILDPDGHVIFTGDCIGHEMNLVEFLDGSFCVSGDRNLYMFSRTEYVIGNIYDGMDKPAPYLRDLLSDSQKRDLGVRKYNMETKEETFINLADIDILDRMLGVEFKKWTTGFKE